MSTQSWREVLLSLKSRGMNAHQSWPSGTVPWGSGPPRDEVYPDSPPPAVLATQNDERAQLLAEAISAKGQNRDTQHLAGREQGGRGEGVQPVHRNL